MSTSTKKVVAVSKSRTLLWKDAVREIQLHPQKLLINLYNGLTELHLNSAAMFQVWYMSFQMCKMPIPYALMHPQSIRDAEFCTGNNKKLGSLSSSVERAEDPSFSKRIKNFVLSDDRTVFVLPQFILIKNKNKIMVCGICKSLHSAYIYILHAFQLLKTN